LLITHTFSVKVLRRFTTSRRNHTCTMTVALAMSWRVPETVQPFKVSGARHEPGNPNPQPEKCK
jgi:hypothetical protein